MYLCNSKEKQTIKNKYKLTLEEVLEKRKEFNTWQEVADYYNNLPSFYTHPQ